MTIDFRALRSIPHLAKATGTDERTIQDFHLDPKPSLTRIAIPRPASSRAPREAWAVSAIPVRLFLKALANSFDLFLRDTVECFPHPCVHGFVKQRSALTNARLHAGKRHLLKADVEDFFPSIRSKKIEAALLRIGLKSEGASLLAKITTLNEVLPLGYPTSPVCSNLAMRELDRQFAELAARYGATFSRYADDITFSSNESLPSLNEIQALLHDEGLVLHPRKSQYSKRGQALYVTGYSVTDVVPHAPRPLKRRLRQELYFIAKFGLAEHLTWVGNEQTNHARYRLFGQIQHVRYVEPDAGTALLEEWDSINMPTRPEEMRPRAPVTLLLAIAEFAFGGVEYRAIGSALLRDDQASAGEALREAAEMFLLDPDAPEESKEAVRTHGIELFSLPEDFRTDIARIAAAVASRVFIVFDRADADRVRQLSGFIHAAIKWRSVQNHRQPLRVILEGDRDEATQALISRAVARLPAELRPKFEIISRREDVAAALPGIFLAAWQLLAEGKTEAVFRTVRPRIGTIFRPSTHELFTSRSALNRAKLSAGSDAVREDVEQEKRASIPLRAHEWAELLRTRSGAILDIERHWDGLTYRPAELRLRFKADGKSVTNVALWNEFLDQALIDMGFRVKKESTRVALHLARSLDRAAVQFGQDSLRLALGQRLKERLGARAPKQLPRFSAAQAQLAEFQASVETVDGLLARLAESLVVKLRYGKDEAEAIVNDGARDYLLEILHVASD